MQNDEINDDTVCSICVENYNRSIRAPIKCEYCDFTACRKCCCTFILSETEPKCMNTVSCNRAWTRQFMNAKMTKSFMNNELKKHREQLLYDSERALLPATQPYVEHQIQIEKMDDEINDLQKLLSQLKDTIYVKQRERLRFIHNYHNTGDLDASQRSTFIRACPDNNCRGFLSTQWKCGICEKWTCSQCYVIKGRERDDETHICDAGDIETAALILRETKSCPNCGMGIFKIEGCDQMFCTECHTAFNWRTGKIQTNNIHNPHYFEWLRRTGGDTNALGPAGEDNRNGEGACNDRNHLRFNHHICTMVRSIINRKYRANVPENIKTLLDHFDTVVRRNIHLQEVELNFYNDGADHIRYNQDLRVKYLRNQIDENQFKILLQRRDKKRQKNREIYNILQMVFNATVDIIFRIYDPIRNTTDWDENVFTPLNEIEALTDYANECLEDVSKTYDGRCKTFGEKLRFS